ncbi:MAG TPA: CopG family transcriptional regulator [Telluria sp.]|nr:CopG family transcriptional regulator [Telluria sp.]
MKVVDIKAKLPDTDKVTVNMGLVDLGQMDLLVAQGFYTNRTDLVRTAVRNLLRQHAADIHQTASRERLSTGLQRFSRRDLEQAAASGQPLEINVLGLATLDDDITPELARAAIASIHVLGAFVASPAVKRALADRIRT